jgi:biotin carboxyl carrier protein
MAEEVRAEMVANVLQVVVTPGEAISAGGTVVILESMKMEIPVLTETAGTIVEVKVEPGDVVRAGDLLAVVG